MNLHRQKILTLIVVLTLSITALSGTSSKRNELKLGQSVWVEGLEAAQSQARQENKPILLLEMMGRLDEKWC